MIQAAEILDIPIIVTEQYPKVFGHSIVQVKNPGIVESKTRFSMFTPNVAAKLVEWKRKKLIIIGLESHVCITQSVLDLLNNQYQVYLLVDGISSANSLEISVALARLSQAGGNVSYCGDIYYCYFF